MINPENAELTMAQSAKLLGVSRPFLVKLLDDDTIPHRKTGEHRRVRREDLMTYKSGIDREREAILDELVRDAQRQDMGYSR